MWGDLKGISLEAQDMTGSGCPLGGQHPKPPDAPQARGGGVRGRRPGAVHGTAKRLGIHNVNAGTTTRLSVACPHYERLTS